MYKRIVIALSASLAAFAFAQTPAPQAAPAATAAAPAHNCVRPEEPGNLGTKSQFSAFNRDVKSYRECLQAFVKAQAALVKHHEELGNNAVKEYNDYVTEMNKKKTDDGK
jgi:hypothetical protein